MYSNDTKQIRNGLVNYIGALLNAVPFEGKAAKQVVVAALVEEAFSMSLDESGELDMYCLKPILRQCKIIFEKRRLELEAMPSIPNIRRQIENYTVNINMLNTLIDSITA